MISRRSLLIGTGVVGAGVVGLAERRRRLDHEPPALPTVNGEGSLLWQSWSGIEHAYPASRAAPNSADEVAAVLKASKAPIRAVGAGHSFTGLVPTDGTLITLDAMSGVVSHDAATNQATVNAGTRLFDLGPALAKIGQEMINLPDINKQSLAGGLATGTHGTGKGIRALHGEVVGFQLATPRGDLIDCDTVHHPDIFNAARVGLGAFGILTQVTLQNRPLKRIHKVSTIRPREEIMDDWPTLQTQHRNVEFLLFPFTHYGVTIASDETDLPIKPRGPDRDADAVMQFKQLRDVFEFAPWLRFKVADSQIGTMPPEEMVDEGWKLLSNERPIRFKEMEYHLPLDAQLPALREVIATIEKLRPDVFFPIEARVIAPDDAWLSPFYQRECGSIAVHAYYKDDHSFLFELIEPIFRRHGGRPHWGKLNSLGAKDFAMLYPRWKDAMAVRQSLDPEGRMLNPYMRKVMLDG